MPSASTLRPVFAAALAAVFAVSLTACAADPVAEQYLSGDGKGYISASGIDLGAV